MAWCCGAPTPKLTDLDQEGQKQADAPQPQEMSTNLLVSTEQSAIAWRTGV